MMKRRLTIGLTVLVIVAAGCGDGDNGSANTPLVATSTPTPTRTAPPATPRVTPTMAAGGHSEILVGSSADGSGRLRVAPEFDGIVEVPFSTCVGGSGSACVGGSRIFLTTDPGFESIESSEPGEGIFALSQDTVVRVVLVSAPASVRLKFDRTLLDQVGESAVLGFVPFHADLEWQITASAGDTLPDPVNVVLRLTTSSMAYQSSADISVKLEPVLEAHEHDHE